MLQGIGIFMMGVAVGWSLHAFHMHSVMRQFNRYRSKWWARLPLAERLTQMRGMYPEEMDAHAKHIKERDNGHDHN